MKEQYEGAALEKSAHYAADPSGMRTGNGPGPQLSETLEQVCADAEVRIEEARDASVERAMIARRASETEIDLLTLLLPRS